MKRLPRNVTPEALHNECKRLNSIRNATLSITWDTLLSLVGMATLGMRHPDSGGDAWELTHLLIAGICEATENHSALLAAFMLSSLPDRPGEEATTV